MDLLISGVPPPTTMRGIGSLPSVIRTDVNLAGENTRDSATISPPAVINAPGLAPKPSVLLWVQILALLAHPKRKALSLITSMSITGSV
ncbi:hypothetical protein EB796_023070 [Bugula neritina]|uniref:Uncharacterized protein n=1 Tax=Bugula neritina TaxID=10212 RepID=A0A7J7IXH0_BUGNE|nr:hypothetical protein EB796_023070 [Bugula neritina]